MKLNYIIPVAWLDNKQWLHPPPKAAEALIYGHEYCCDKSACIAPWIIDTGRMVRLRN